MMRVIVEVVPFGEESCKREIARIEIANVSGLAAVSDYEVSAKLADRAPLVRATVREHRRADGWERLVRRVVDAVAYASRFGAEPPNGNGERVK